MDVTELYTDTSSKIPAICGNFIITFKATILLDKSIPKVSPNSAAPSALPRTEIDLIAGAAARRARLYARADRSGRACARLSASRGSPLWKGCDGAPAPSLLRMHDETAIKMHVHASVILF